jgi:hypothetical protein
LTTTSGQIFRIAGGAPFALSRWSLFGGVRPSVTIDQWDLANISSPAAHLNATPFDGTVVEALPSRTYWVFAGGHRRLTSARAAAVQVDDAGLAAFAGIPCTVPRLKQLTLRQVRRVLRGADCRLGRVQLRRVGQSSGLHVIKQAPRPRTTRAASWAVEITLG